MAFSSATLVAAAARRFSGAGAAGATDAGAAAVPNHPPGDAWAGVVAAAAPLTPPRPATKIVATLGRSSVDDDGALIDALLAAGVSCARLDNSAARGTTFMREQYAALQASAEGGDVAAWDGGATWDSCVSLARP